jgi:hypothetical protein
MITTLHGKDISSISSPDLVTAACNAFVTGRKCLGHKKAARNEYIVFIIDTELSARGETLPDEDFMQSHGKFNGQGAS